MVDTTEHSDTAEYLSEIAANAIALCEQRFSCHIGSFVTDNASNIAKMRK